MGFLCQNNLVMVRFIESWKTAHPHSVTRITGEGSARAADYLFGSDSIQNRSNKTAGNQRSSFCKLPISMLRNWRSAVGLFNIGSGRGILLIAS